ncbi:hypothetical protein YTPLAS18_00770 [Nitrospira sp.]|nr:hypothetical protein YTPLAS18_00770 [Nitrospira sp.]
MNRDQARALVRSTFTHAFDKVKFRNFVINLLNKLDEAKAFFYNSAYIKDAFKEHVSRFERLGTYTSPEGAKLDVLIVHLTNESKLERARTAIRNFVADHLRQRDNKEAALVAFVSPTEQQWRFSYVKMEYATVQKESGKIGVESRLTPARRFSYIVGKGESCHTAQARFLDLLQDTKDNPTLVHVEDAFSVEAVTKEFFTQYRKLFEDINAALENLAIKDKTIRDEFRKNHVNTVDFAKKLMGQIVFLYFLQKKGWLGVEKGKDWGTGPHNFLRQLADSKYGTYANFFNDILEPLFYDTLATDRGHEAWCKTFKCRIPFLNGGLFEPLGDYDWKRTDIILPDKLFTNYEIVEEGITGTGVLDVFERYNFTVNEAEPLEKEVAIDPEMLGKVFENLIEENRRKGLGSYYTPREVVHYMCQESLINYLNTALNTEKEFIAWAKPIQTKLLGEPEPEQLGLKTTVQRENIPRSDIATFVHLGDQISHYEAVETRYAIKMPNSIEKHARLIDEKLAEITVCDPAVGSGAFPVGMMAEIVRARSALTPYFNDIHDRTPYHFKRHAIQNCLYGVDIDPGAVEIAKLRLWLSLVVDEQDVKQIKPLPNLDYRVVTGNSLLGFPFKSQRLHEIEKLKARFFEEADYDRKARLKQDIEKTLIECFESSKRSLGYEVNFDFGIYFSEVFDAKGGFDVVIANPPYVRQEKLKEIKPTLKAVGYECFNGIADLFVYFYERGIKLLRVGGAIAFISSNKYYRSGYGKALRGFLARELTLDRLIDFGDAPVFEAIAYASILTGVRVTPSQKTAPRCYTWEQGMSFDRIAQVIFERGQEIPQSELKPEGWQFKIPGVYALRHKIKLAGVPLGTFVHERIYNGIKSGHKDAFTLSNEQRHRFAESEPESRALIKPLLKGRDIRRWRIEPTSRWLLYVSWHFPYKPEDAIDSSSTAAEKAFRKQFPKVFAHLATFREELLKRDQSEIGIRYEWFCLSRPRPESAPYFKSPKIVFPDIAVEPSFAWDNLGHAVENTAYFIPAQKWLLGVLNSKVAFWFLCQISNTIRGGFVRFIRQYVEQIPIPDASPEKQQAVECLVDRILAAKQEGVEADVSALEQEIDQMVYALYGLTREEIQIVEASAR